MKLLLQLFGTRRQNLVATALFSLSAALCAAQSSNQPPPRVDFSAFKIINERNIFNPRRHGRTDRPVDQPAARVDSFTLVGTMSYEKGPFAFFEGTTSELRKVAKVSDAIAGYKITNIAYNSVRLASETNEVQMAVGMQMRREDNGPWHVASASEISAAPAARDAKSGDASVPTASTAANGNDQSSSASTPDSTTTSAGTDDPVLRRLMQRREQENNR